MFLEHLKGLLERPEVSDISPEMICVEEMEWQYESSKSSASA
jgi:hypothetical protein